MCGRATDPAESLGSLCGRCDKIVGDVEAEMAFTNGHPVR
jgi:hypothetical protein